MGIGSFLSFLTVLLVILALTVGLQLRPDSSADRFHASEQALVLRRTQIEIDDEEARLAQARAAAAARAVVWTTVIEEGMPVLFYAAATGIVLLSGSISWRLFVEGYAMLRRGR